MALFVWWWVRSDEVGKDGVGKTEEELAQIAKAFDGVKVRQLDHTPSRRRG